MIKKTTSNVPGTALSDFLFFLVTLDSSSKCLSSFFSQAKLSSLKALMSPSIPTSQPSWKWYHPPKKYLPPPQQNRPLWKSTSPCRYAPPATEKGTPSPAAGLLPLTASKIPSILPQVSPLDSSSKSNNWFRSSQSKDAMWSPSVATLGKTSCMKVHETEPQNGGLHLHIPSKIPILIKCFLLQLFFGCKLIRVLYGPFLTGYS